MDSGAWVNRVKIRLLNIIAFKDLTHIFLSLFTLLPQIQVSISLCGKVRHLITHIFLNI